MAEPPARLRIKEIGARIDDVRLRIPFRFGNTTLTESPQITLRVVVEDGMGRRATGYSGDLLAAAWFNKDPDRSIEEKTGDLIEIIGLAMEAYRTRASSFVTPFELWWDVYRELKTLAQERGINALSAGFGSSLPERAVIDAVCRLLGLPFYDAMARNAFGIEPHVVHPELAEFDLRSALSPKPLDGIWCRHTVGLGDPLRAGDLRAEDRINDGLPETLVEDIATYGLSYFKIKIETDRERNLSRLTRIAEVLAFGCPNGFHVTLDGNEQVADLEDVKWLLSKLKASPNCRALARSVLFVEQPLPRDAALSDDVKSAIEKLGKSCRLILDESDDDVNSLVRGRELGYSGISTKNCKGVFKAVLNKCLITKWNSEHNGDPMIFSSEDLTNTGVLPLQQDFATIAALGIDHSERNGHHYFKGLSHLSDAEQKSALLAHGDLYEERGGFVSPRISHGRMQIGSIQSVGYGYDCNIEFNRLLTIDEWRARNETSKT